MRRVLGLLMMVDAVFAVVLLWTLERSAISHPFASPVLLGIGANPPALITIGSVALISGWFFSRGIRPVLSGLSALISVGLLVEAQGALLEGPMRFLFFASAVLLGWLAGWLISEKEEFANAGALGALAACYLGAVTSKLFTSGFAWVTDSGLRSTIASQHHWGSSRLLDALALFVLEHEWVAYSLAAFTLLAQASAVLLPFSLRLRRIAVVLLLTFHVGVWLLTPISFPQAMVLLVAAAFVREPTSTLTLPKRSLRVLGVGVAVFVALAWLPPLREYTKFQHARPFVMTPEPPKPQPAEVTMTGLPVGLVIEGFTVVSLGKSQNDGTPWARLTRGGEVVTIELLPHGARPFEPPAKSKSWSPFYRQAAPGEASPSDEERLKLLNALSAQLDFAFYAVVRASSEFAFTEINWQIDEMSEIVKSCVFLGLRAAPRHLRVVAVSWAGEQPVLELSRQFLMPETFTLAKGIALLVNDCGALFEQFDVVAVGIRVADRSPHAPKQAAIDRMRIEGALLAEVSRRGLEPKTCVWSEIAAALDIDKGEKKAFMTGDEFRTIDCSNMDDEERDALASAFVAAS